MITEFSTRQYPDTLVLFDVDGTLTPARNVGISPSFDYPFTHFLNSLFQMK
jgi:hypothetical protein